VNNLIRTLIVDDSAFVRKVVREMLSRSPFIDVVGAARDGEEALEMVEQLRPDVVTCDLQMPRVDGVTFVREQMSRRPLPILILTASAEDAAGTLEAMQAGAVDFVRKPSALANDEILVIRNDLVEKVKTASRACVAPLPAGQELAAISNGATSAARRAQFDVVVIGISTGGPQALRYLIPQFPADFPIPIVMVLHMPVGYTELYAQKLGEVSRLKVKEAAEGDPVVAGTALLAPAGKHMLFRRTANNHVITELSSSPTDTPHKPAADVLFQSAAEVYHDRVLGIVMTGMGNDGRQGAAWIKAQGGTVLTEAEESCVIYGMPRSVVESGLSDGAIRLGDMAKAILERI
jgi:two-component system, chemotaxis family, protein-glutamate methylesterase/glutaminase